MIIRLDLDNTRQKVGVVQGVAQKLESPQIHIEGQIVCQLRMKRRLVRQTHNIDNFSTCCARLEVIITWTAQVRQDGEPGPSSPHSHASNLPCSFSNADVTVPDARLLISLLSFRKLTRFWWMVFLFIQFIH